MKILVGTFEVAGYYSRLMQGFGEIGVKADFYQVIPHSMCYKACKSSFLIQNANAICGFLDKLRYKDTLIIKIVRRCISALVYFYSLFFYTHYIYAAATSYLPWHLDYRISRFCGNKILCIYHGSDSRPSYLDGSENSWSNEVDIHKLYKLTKDKKNQTVKIDRLANHVIDTFLNSHFHVRKCIHYLTVGIPLTDYGDCLERKNDERDKFVILHCPSIKKVKGTDSIIKVLEILQKEIPYIEFQLLTGMPQEKVAEAIKNADLVIDQLYSDTPMAHFAAECAALGKPVIVGGYGWGENCFVLTGL